MEYLRLVYFCIILTFVRAENPSNRLDLTETANENLESLHNLIEVLKMDPMLLPDLSKESWAIDIYFTKGLLKGLSRMKNIRDFFITSGDGKVHISASFYYDELDAVYNYLIKMGLKSSGSMKVAVIDTRINLNITLNTLARNLDNISINIPRIREISFRESSIIGHAKSLMGSNPQEFIRIPAEEEINQHLKKVAASINKEKFISYEDLESITKYDVEDYPSLLEGGVNSIIKHFKLID